MSAASSCDDDNMLLRTELFQDGQQFIYAPVLQPCAEARRVVSQLDADDEGSLRHRAFAAGNRLPVCCLIVDC